MKKYIYSSLIAGFTALSCHASQPCVNCIPEVEPPPPLKRCCVENLYVTASYLSWQAMGDYLTYAFLNDSFDSDPNAVQNLLFTGDAITSKFKFQPGYKFGVGYMLPEWGIYAEYTNFQSKVSSFQGTSYPPERIYAAWLTFINPLLLQDVFQSASAFWKVDLEMMDAQIQGRAIHRRCFDFIPAFGIRGLKLTQVYNLEYVTIEDEITLECFNKSVSSGIGPRFLLNSHLNVCRGLGLFNDLGMSLLLIRDKVTVEQINPILSEITPPPENNVTYSNNQTLRSLKPILDLSLGVKYGRDFFAGKSFFQLLLSYDYSFYWNQGSIQLGRAPLVAPGGPLQVLVGDSGKSQGDLSIQGLRATILLSF